MAQKATENRQATISLGPFQLVDFIGEGTMGRVYRGRHKTEAADVALKVMTGELAQETHFRRAFRREVHAMAQLSHPAIATVYDLGEVNAETSRASQGALVEGSPWLAMEYVDGRSLSERPEAWGWDRLRQFLLRLLDALAHSHAAGVIHRDLKPSNVLIHTAGPGEDQLKLVDFGVARIVDPEEEAEGDDLENRISGTPKYMAPEQIKGEKRDQGPWTDLYAVGCLAWRMLCGQPPYTGDEIRDIFLGHLKSPIPEPNFQVDVPDGVGDWMKRLLSKDPRDRYRRAADAARALADVTAQGASMDGQRLEIIESTLAVEETWVEDEAEDSFDDELEAVDASLGDPNDSNIPLMEEFGLEGGFESSPDGGDGAASGEDERETSADDTGGATRESEAPAPPDDWRRPQPSDLGPEIRGAGLGLFGLRRIPVVDRQDTRSFLWDQIHAIHEQRRPRVVLLEGPPGCGRKRLCEWLARRGHETGAVSVMQATHSRQNGPRDGLAPMLARYLRGLGLEPDEMVARLEPLYGDVDDVEPAVRHEMRSLAEWMAAKGGDEGFSSIPERRRAIGSLLQRVSNERPLLIRLDDVQWGRETLDTVRSLVDSDVEIAALIVMNAEADTADRDDDIGQLLRNIVDHETGFSRLASELDFDDQRRLAQEVLGLEPELAEKVAQRTGGHPMMAVQLVGDWVEQGVLEPGDSGFTAPDDIDLSMPDSAREVWQRRIERVWREYPESDRGAARAALEMAAVLGQSLTDEEWGAITDTVGLDEPDRLLDLLSRRGLIEQDEAGWSFAHDKLRQQLERHADDQGRIDVYHRTCADLLDRVYPSNEPGLASRIAAHRIAGGDLSGALEPTREVIRRALDAGDMEAAQTWLDRRQRAMDDLAMEISRRPRIEQLALAGEAAAEAGKPDIAEARAEEAIEIADDQGYTSVLGDAHRLRATLRRAASSFSGGLRDCHRALQSYERAADTEGIARACYETARICRLVGESDKAETYFQRAMERFEELGGENLRAMITSDLGTVWIMERQFGQAERALRVGLSMAQERGNRKVAAASWNRLGDVERHRENLERAGRYYRRAANLARAPGTRRQIALNRIILALEREQTDWARDVLTRVLGDFERNGINAPKVHLTRAWVAAEYGQWDDFDDALATAQELLARRDLVDVDFPWLALRAGRTAGEAGQKERATTMLTIAVEQWRAQGEDERARELTRLIKKIDG